MIQATGVTQAGLHRGGRHLHCRGDRHDRYITAGSGAAGAVDVGQAEAAYAIAAPFVTTGGGDGKSLARQRGHFRTEGHHAERHLRTGIDVAGVGGADEGIDLGGEVGGLQGAGGGGEDQRSSNQHRTVHYGLPLGQATPGAATFRV